MSSISHSVETFNIEFCGGLVAVAHARVRLDSQQGLNQSKRGVISEFSPKSRLRMLKLMAKINWTDHKAIFITLTYPQTWPDNKTAKNHARAFLKRINRRFPDVKIPVIWRLEFQERGAPHFHLLLIDMPFIHYTEIQQMWMDIIGETNQRVFTRIEMIQSKRHAMYYVSKYMAKRKPLHSGFNPVPYLADNEPESEFLGRLWGIENRTALPLCPTIYFTVTGLWGAIWQFKRYARKIWHRINNHYAKGFTLFVDNIDQWVRLFRHCITDLDHYDHMPLWDWREVMVTYGT